ncbi:histone-lysine N-methyltransferase SETMAR [Narcine bancroftii]|uniref:histone-lysine N-methyltransferase SETMAR n=1 Tax=Narcine bancroftii TaxID=1343680 RepID=UPI0038316BA6
MTAPSPRAARSGRVLIPDVSGGLEYLPVPVVNGVDDEGLPRMQYTPENVAGPGDLDPAEINLPGCDCLTSSCQLGTCICLQCYQGAYDKNKCLVDLNDKTNYSRPVFECNIMCKCSETCENRLVQRGLVFKLQVFRTSKKGWGLRTLEPIERGRFVSS